MGANVGLKVVEGRCGCSLLCGYFVVKRNPVCGWLTKRALAQRGRLPPSGLGG
jgi:hypothetical protein